MKGKRCAKETNERRQVHEEQLMWKGSGWDRDHLYMGPETINDQYVSNIFDKNKEQIRRRQDYLW